MFVFSLKTSKKKLIFFIALTLVVILCCFFLFRKAGNEPTAVSSIGKYSLSARDNADRLQFLAQFGWKAGEEPVEVCDVTIPAVFSHVYQDYNQIQKDQGLNLEKYKGKSCKRFTYRILNYENNPESVTVNLMVFKNNVIGGDVSSNAHGGFMHGFVKPNKKAKVR